MRFDQHFISSVISEARFIGAQPKDFQGVSLDSRQIKKGEYFVALKGAQVDGHNFLLDAATNGATGLIIQADQESALQKIPAAKRDSLFIILVPNTEKALLKLAAAWRAQFSIPVVGVTGSIGKTSTKETLANILTAAGMNYIASQGNQNTALGIAINILRLRAEHQAAIFEMGVSKRGEMARMADIARPTIGIITFIGHSHLEGLGSLNDIANEKRDIFKYFKESNIGIINGDQQILAQISYTHPIIKFGYKTTNQVQARKVQINNSQIHFILKLYKERLLITLNSNHSGLVSNALAAASAAYLLNINSALIVKGIQTPLSIQGRFQPTKLKHDKGILINDCYNANPESMKAALLAFEKVESKGQKIAVLGDMLELGVNSPYWHRQLGRFLRKVPSLNHVILVGDHVKWTKDTVPMNITFEHVPSWKEASELLKKRLEREAAILVKGSRGMNLTHLVEELID